MSLLVENFCAWAKFLREHFDILNHLYIWLKSSIRIPLADSLYDYDTFNFYHSKYASSSCTGDESQSIETLITAGYFMFFSVFWELYMHLAVEKHHDLTHCWILFPIVVIVFLMNTLYCLRLLLYWIGFFLLWISFMVMNSINLLKIG